MKRWLIGFLITVLLGSSLVLTPAQSVVRRPIVVSSGTPIVRVNTTFGVDFTGTQLATLNSSAFSATTGNLVAVFVTYYYGANGDSPTTITDTAGNTYTEVDKQADASTQAVISYYAKNITGHASNVVTLQFTTQNVQFVTLMVVEYSGLSTTSPLDAHVTGTAVGAMSVTSSTFTTTTANQVVIAGGYNNGGSTNLTAGSGYTIRVAPEVGRAAEDKIVSGILTNDTAVLNGSQSGDWSMCVMTFKQ